MHRRRSAREGGEGAWREQRGRKWHWEGHGVLNHRTVRLLPVYCWIKRSDCYVMDHLYAATLNSSSNLYRSRSIPTTSSRLICYAELFTNSYRTNFVRYSNLTTPLFHNSRWIIFYYCSPGCKFGFIFPGLLISLLFFFFFESRNFARAIQRRSDAVEHSIM